MPGKACALGTVHPVTGRGFDGLAGRRAGPVLALFSRVLFTVFKVSEERLRIPGGGVPALPQPAWRERVMGILLAAMVLASLGTLLE